MQFARRSASPFETSCSPSPQGVKVGNGVGAEHHGLTIDDELLERVLQRGLDDPRIAPRPVMTIAGEQPHAIAVAVNEQAEAVVFDFVGPVRGRKDDFAAGRYASGRETANSPARRRREWLARRAFQSRM
jgi:hypothetical protein